MRLPVTPLVSWQNWQSHSQNTSSTITSGRTGKTARILRRWPESRLWEAQGREIPVSILDVLRAESEAGRPVAVA
jgi:hypothetical protein